MNETRYRRDLVSKIRQRFPGCYVMRPDPRETQGIPDILILHNNTWAMLEIKIDGKAEHQPNQDYYVEQFSHMSFASFINPQSEEDVLSALQYAFESSRPARVS